MGIIRDVMGGGLIGRRTLVGIFLILLAIISFFVAVGEDYLGGYLVAILLLLVGIVLYKY